MQNKNLIRFLQSLILLPAITVSMPLENIQKNFLKSGISAVSSQIVLSQKNMEANGLLAFNQVMDNKAQILQAQADAIDGYFKAHNTPLFGTGMKMALEARKNGLDWRLLPAIAMIESTGGKFACKNASHSFFGWGSCKISFSSDEEAIEIVAWNLGGNNPATASYYADKTTKEILRKYNPPHIVPNYTAKVIRVMNIIGDEEIIITPENSAAA